MKQCHLKQIHLKQCEWTSSAIRDARAGIVTIFVSAMAIGVAACTPTVQVAAPKEPITINLNIKLDAEVRVKLEETAREDITKNPDIF